MKLTHALAFPALLVTAAALNAQTTPPPPQRTFGNGTLPEFLQPYDIDKDGKLSAEEREAARKDRADRQKEAFDRCDTDGDGKLSREEIEAARAAARQKIEDLRKQRFEEADKDDSGALDKDEFAAMCRIGTLPQDVIDRIFSYLDADASGGISLEEFMRSFQPPPPPPQIPPFATADADSSGDVTSAEFVAACTAAGIPELKAKEIFARLDWNKDGVLKPGEYPGTMPPPPPPPQPKPLPEFAVADVDQSGFLSPMEFKAAAMVAMIPGREADEMFIKADANRDRRLSAEEYGTLLPPAE